jgi:two-component sensor histidine kinase
MTAATTESRLREVLRDEVLMMEQSVRTLREMRASWRELVDEQFEGRWLIEDYLDSLIEDLDTTDARTVLDAE